MEKLMVRLLIILTFICQPAFGQMMGIESKIWLNQKFGHGSSYIAPSGTGIETLGVLEPSVTRNNTGGHDIYYTAWDGTHTVLAKATTDADFSTVTKLGVVIGNGTVVTRDVNCAEVVVEGDTTFVFAASTYSGTNIYLYTSVAGAAFVDQGPVINASLIPGLVGFGNSGFLTDSAIHVVKVGGKYQYYVEGNEGFQWMTYRLESTSLRGPYTYKGKITSLQVGTGSWSGPEPIWQDSTVNMFYHYSSAGTIPTWLGFATSTDLDNFTKKEIPFKAFEALPFGSATDQNADPRVIPAGNKVFLLSEYARNSAGYQFTIYKWTYNGTFKQLVTGLQSCIGCVGIYP